MGVPGVPCVELVRNAFGAHDAVEILILSEALVVPTCAEDVGVAPVVVEEPWVAQVRQVVRGQIEVAILVVVAVEKIRDVECARHGEQTGEDIWMAESDVGGVVAAEAAAQRNKMRVVILLTDERHDFVDEVVLVLHVAGDAPARRDVAVVPALHVDRVDAEELQVAAVDLAGDGADHVAIFELVEAAAGGGKDENRHARVAEDEQFHVAAEAAGIPLVIFAVHAGLPSLRVGAIRHPKDEDLFLGAPDNWRTAVFLIL